MLKDRTKVSPSPRVAEAHTHKIQVARKPQRGKNSNFYALLVTDNELTTLPRRVKGKAELELE